MSKKLPDTICPEPFLYVYPNHRGNWKPCCKTYTWSGKKDQSFDEYWYEDQNLHDLRRSLITGEESEIWKDTCKNCIKSENAGAGSHRTLLLESIKNTPYVKEALAEMVDGFMSTGQVMTGKRVYRIKVRGFGNECNLKCYMCDPQFSTSKNAELSKLSDDSISMFFPDSRLDRAKEILTYNKTISKNNDKTKSQLLEVIEELKPQINKLNLAGGEPVMISEYYDLLDSLIESGDSKEIQISMSTNCTRTGIKNKNMLDYIPYFRNFSIIASIDDIGERDDYIRYPSKFSDVVNNVEKYKKNKKCNIFTNVTWSILNIANAENIIRTLEEMKVPATPNINIVHSPVDLHPSNHPMRDELIEKYLNSGNNYLVNLGKILQSKTFNEQQFNNAVKYIKNLDSKRGTNASSVFPELKEYLA